MESKKPNKVNEIGRLQQILKKLKKPPNAPKSTSTTSSEKSSSSNKGIKFLKRTLSLTDISNDSNVPKGFLAVCVGREQKRFIIPTEFLSHQSFRILLREAEEEFGFQQEGVLKIPCEVSLFEKILKMVEENRDTFFLHESGFSSDNELVHCLTSESELSCSYHPQMCR